MDHRLQTAQKECHVTSDSPAMSEEANETHVSMFNLDSAEGIPREVEITKTTSSRRGVDIKSHSPITDVPNYPSSDSAYGIPPEDEFNITNSSNGGLDIQNCSPIVYSRHYSKGTVTLMLGCEAKSTAVKDPFYLDSGANIHATGNRKLISHLTTDKAGILVKMANGSFLRSHGCGSVITEDYTFPNVHYVPGLGTNVVSVSELNDLDYDLEFTRTGCIIKDGRTNTIAGKGIRGASRLFELDSLRVPLNRIGCVNSREAPS